MKPRLLIFDLDGVLLDSCAMAEQYMIDLYPGLTGQTAKELLVGNWHEEMAKMTILPKKETEAEGAARQALYAKNKMETPMYPGIPELLKELHQAGHTLVLNTSAHDRHSVPILEYAKINSLFDFLATGDVSKSKVEKFKMIEKKYGLSGADVLFVTDTLGDIREADLAGVNTVAVTYGAHDRSYFAREEHKNLIGIVDTVSELKNFIKNY